MVKGLPASLLLQTHGRPDKRAANGARGLVSLLMIALSSLTLIIPGRLNRIMNAVVSAFSSPGHDGEDVQEDAREAATAGTATWPRGETKDMSYSISTLLTRNLDDVWSRSGRFWQPARSFDLKRTTEEVYGWERRRWWNRNTEDRSGKPRSSGLSRMGLQPTKFHEGRIGWANIRRIWSWPSTLPHF